MTPELRAACRDAVHVLTPDGQVLKAGRAALFVLRGLGYPVGLFALPPFIWGVEAGYQVVARNRRLFARFMFRRE
jgi:hypothetical protein